MTQKRPFHATIITGNAELRRQRAIEIAQTLVCEGEEKPCNRCRHCRKVAQGIHPDVIFVEQFMEEKDVGSLIRINVARALRNDAAIIPNEATHKVYIIDNAQTMNDSSQSALLKVLEEGPPYAAFLLLCDSAGALLETIRSRCGVVNVGWKEDGREWNEQALAYARVLARGTELDKVGFLTRLELSKPDKGSLDSFLTDLEDLLREAAVGGITGNFTREESRELARSVDRGKLLAQSDWVRQAREMTVFHVATGHILGWLGIRLL